MVFWVILGIVIGNLLLGFALAVFLNRRYQTLVLGKLGLPSECSTETLSPGQTPRSVSPEPSSEDLPEQPAGAFGKEAAPVSPERPPQELGEYGAGTTEEAFSPEVSGELLEEHLVAQEPSGALPEELSQPSAKSETAGQVEPANEPGDSLGGKPPPSVADWQSSEGSGPEQNLSQPAASPSEEEPLLLADQKKTEPLPPKETSVSIPEADANSRRGGESSSDGTQSEPMGHQKPGGISASVPEAHTEVAPSGEKGPILAARHPEESQTAAQNSGLAEDLRRAVPPSGQSPKALGAIPETAEPEIRSGTEGSEKRSGSHKPAQTSPSPSPPASPSPPEESAPAGPAGGRQAEESSSRSETFSFQQSGPEASLERALAQWQAEAARYFAELSRTRTKVHHFSGAPQMEEIRTSWQEIHRAGQDYLATARPVREAFGQLANLTSSMASVRDHLNTLSAKEEALIELTQELIPTAAEASDSHLLCQQLLQHTDRLMEANRKVQTALEAARRGPTDQTPPAEVSGRFGPGSGFLLDESIREKVAAWWEEHRTHMHRLSVIMLEVDDFAEIQEEFGPSFTEGLLRAIERLLALESGEGGFLAPLSGPRFGLFCANRSLDQAVAVAEHLRQTLMATRFYRKKAELRISLSCGVTEATRDDTPETVLERAEVALLQARRYGKGRTFSHDGYFPMPVPAHPLAISPKQMEI